MPSITPLPEPAIPQPPSEELLLLSESHASPSHNPILEGVHFSLEFVVTLQWVLLGLVFVLTLYHHHLATGSSKRYKTADTDLTHKDNASTSAETTPAAAQCVSSGESSSSRSIDSQSTINKELEHERTPLLRRQSPVKPPSPIQNLRRKCRAVMMYHPTGNKEMQGNDTSAFVLLLLGVNIFYTFYRIEFTRPLVYVLADRTGLLFLCNLPWLYLLSAKNQPFRLLTGTSYECLNILHRGLGKWLAMLAIVHAMGMVIVWYDFLLPRGLDVWWYLSRHIIWTGIVAFSCYIILSLTSSVAFRAWFYELFLACHIVLQAGGLVFLFLHHERARGNVGLSLFIFLVDRVVYRWAIKTRAFDAELKVMEDGDTIMVSASWLLEPRHVKPFDWIFSQSLRQGWDTSDHVFLSVPAMAHKHRIQAHPFTIASAAPASHQDHAWFNLIIRARDGFTRELLDYARSHNSAKVVLDGPYGSTHAYHKLARSDAAIIVAGGSGIAVAYPMLWRLLHENQTRPTEERAPVKACLIWVVHDATHISWIGRERLQELEDKGLKVVLPPPTATAGRPDIPALVRDTVSQLGGSSLKSSIGVVVSGPDAMNRSVRNACASLAWQGLDINVAVEVFDW